MSFVGLFVLACTMGLAGLVMAVALLRSGWPGWVGWPLSILGIRLAVDAGLAPAIRYGLGIGRLEVTDASIIIPPGLEEVPAAIGTLAIGYGSIGAGMLVARRLWQRSGGAKRGAQEITAVEARKGYRAATSLFVFGAVLHVVAIYYGGRGLTILQIASTRAAFTNVEAYSSEWFNYAWLLKGTMQVGALAMLLLAYRSGQRATGAWMANIAYIAVQPVFGGRTAVVVSGVGLLLSYHYGVRRVRPAVAIVVGACVLSGLSYIAVVRHGHGSIPDAMVASVTQLASSHAMEEVAFALRTFPEDIEFLEGASMLAGLSHAIPGYKVEGNLWRTLENQMFGSDAAYKSRGNGGGTVSTTGESYMNFGLAGVLIIGVLTGALFGGIYEWQRRDSGDPFAVLVAVLATLAFIIVIYKKLPSRLGDMPLDILVPLGFIIAWIRGNNAVAAFSAICVGIVLGLAMFKLTNEAYTKVVAFFSMVFLYAYCFRLLIQWRKRSRPKRSIRSASLLGQKT